MEKLKSLVWVFLYSLIFITANAQNEKAVTQISGTITDQKGTGLPGVTVNVKGKNISTVTDENGRFKINVPIGQKALLVSSVGYADQEFIIGGKNDITIHMKESSKKLDDVVVVGYGTQKRKDLTGSVSSVSSDQMNLGGTTADLGQAIQGRAAGVQVQQSNFAPGAGLSITIRGGNSINTTNAPLYVVDGLITDNGNLVNPNDIADIQILKDASAAAIYGSRGGNGVILITTKKGKAGKIAIEGDLSNGKQYVTYKPALINGPQYTASQNAIAVEDGNPPPFPSSFPVTNTNWWQLATQQAQVNNRGVNVSSNDKNSKIYVSVNYMNQIGVLKHTDFERYSARIGAEKTLNERIKIGANFYGASSNADNQTYTGDITAPLYGIMLSPPNIPAYNPDGSYYKYQGRNNALAALLEPTNVSGNKLFNGNMYIDYSVLKNLTYHISLGGEYSQTTAGQYIPVTLTAGLANSGIAGEQMSTAFRWLSEQYLTYKFTTGPHNFTAMLGTSSQKDVAENLGAGSKRFPTDLFLFYNLSAGSIPTSYVSGKSEAKLASYFGRLNYSYNDEFLATFTLRDDGSSKFGPNNRFGIFPSGALAWKLTDRKFIQNLNTFSNLKLRMSYGLTGNDRIGNYAYMSTFSNYSTVLAPGSPLQVGIEPSSLSNNNLKWESTAQFDAGLDMGFVNGKINATIDFYHKKTTNLLLAIPIGQWWGFNSQIANAGSIENKGIEIAINTDNFKSKEFSWNSSFNFAYNIQKCLSLSNNISFISSNTANPSGVVSAQEFTRLMPGKELGVLYGYKYAGVIKTGEHYAPQPNSKPGDPKYQDLNGDGIINPSDRTFLGNTTPHFIAGFGNDFHYKGFDLNIFFQGAFGYYLYNMNRLVLESTTGTAVLDRWVANTNENTDVPREGYFLSKYGSYVNSRFVENASYVRLKMVSLAYNIPVNLVKQLKFINGIQIYASGQNLLTFTKYTGTDPEVNAHTNNIGGGLDFGVFPAFRTFILGAKISIQ
ncbi:MAG: TonB-dependent receptor [Bacteroidetes bacterium]|nr:TonB-dependent receptor [Bacteroidota bacterium]